MQSYTEVVPPTGVTHALALPFLSPTSRNLIVARHSLLQIFSTQTSTISHGTSSGSERGQNTKLVLIDEYPLSGTVTSLGRVKIIASKSGGEAILVAFRDAKLSLIEWDPERHGIATVSIHYYENENLQRSPWAPSLDRCMSYLTVDPSSRCAVLQFGMRNIAVIPFYQPGDDLVMDDYDEELDGARSPPKANGTSESGKDQRTFQTPYTASFVLPLTALDPGLLHPISLQFLHEYREPTFGVLYSQGAVSSALYLERKDIVCYAVFTLDLEQRASTILLSVTRLPSDLHTVVPLPLPVGGALLVGNNEVIHVDQAGKTNAVGCNEFSRQASSFSMADQSDLELKLEGCVVQRVGNESGDVLIATATGDLAMLSFNLDGRTVSGLHLRRIPTGRGGSLVRTRTSCSAYLGRGRVFFGSEESDSVVLGWSRRQAQARITSSDDIDNVQDDEGLLTSDEEDDNEDDLYSGHATNQLRQPTFHGTPAAGDDHIRLHDRLFALGLVQDITIGREHESALKSNAEYNQGLDLVISTGKSHGGSLAILKRALEPQCFVNFPMATCLAVWSAAFKIQESSEGDESEATNPKLETQYVLTTKMMESGEIESQAFSFRDNNLVELEGTDFDPTAGETIDMGAVGNGGRIVQVLPGEIRSYEKDFGLAQIFPLTDEDAEDPSVKVVAASFCDPFVLVLRNDGSISLLKADSSGDLEEVSLGEPLTKSMWLTGCLYHDYRGRFSIEKQEQGVGSMLLFLLSKEERIYIFDLSEAPEQIYVAEGAPFLPPLLAPEYKARRSTAKDTLIEILVADLGDMVESSPHLILRTSSDDIAIYQPFWSQIIGATQPPILKFAKTPNRSTFKLDGDLSGGDSAHHCPQARLRVLKDIGGYSSVFVPGDFSRFVIKTSQGQPNVIPVRQEAIVSLCPILMNEQRGFAYLDAEGTLQIATLPPGFNYSLSSWAAKKIDIEGEVDSLVYSESSDTYVLGVCTLESFRLPDDDEIHPEWRDEDITLHPQAPQGYVRLISPKTWKVIDTFELQRNERVMCMKNINLDISEETHERKDLIVVGTAVTRGEDVVARGTIYVFDVIEVVPDPERSDTGRRLKLVAKEEVKGPVTSLTQVGGQGYFLAAQGQKCLVRGLREDGRIPPVAFLDMQCYVTTVKELDGTGMCLMGDVLKGIWFVGYSEDPYRLTLFGKDTLDLEIIAAEFLPDGRNLYILVGDGDCNLHVLQYDPEHPKSSKGDRLLHRSTFHLGHFITKMVLLPRMAVPSEVSAAAEPDAMEIDDTIPQHQVLVLTQSGALGLVTPLSESAYRRLSALQTQLINTLDHPCSLNPRAYRAVESDGIGGRGIIDGSLTRRYLDLSSQKKADVAMRVGAGVVEIRSDLESIGGAGLGYL